jgi:hypothetical protein
MCDSGIAPGYHGLRRGSQMPFPVSAALEGRTRVGPEWGLYNVQAGASLHLHCIPEYGRYSGSFRRKEVSETLHNCCRNGGGSE